MARQTGDPYHRSEFRTGPRGASKVPLKSRQRHQHCARPIVGANRGKETIEFRRISAPRRMVGNGATNGEPLAAISAPRGVARRVDGLHHGMAYENPAYLFADLVANKGRLNAGQIRGPVAGPMDIQIFGGVIRDSARKPRGSESPRYIGEWGQMRTPDRTLYTDPQSRINLAKTQAEIRGPAMGSRTAIRRGSRGDRRPQKSPVSLARRTRSPAAISPPPPVRN